jgi:hypothetical protein
MTKQEKAAITRINMGITGTMIMSTLKCEHCERAISGRQRGSGCMDDPMLCGNLYSPIHILSSIPTEGPGLHVLHKKKREKSDCD